MNEATNNLATINSWEVNQGKRLLKRLHNSGVMVGMELAFVHQALMTAAAAVAVDQAKGEGLSAEESTERAHAMMTSIKHVEPSGHMGLDCYRILVANGSAPGRVKAELDKVLFVAGISPNSPNELGTLDCVRGKKFRGGEFKIIAVDEASHLDTASGEELDRLAAVVGITRRDAVEVDPDPLVDRFPQHNIPRDNY